MSFFHRFLFSSPPSLYLTIMSPTLIIMGLYVAFSEANGKNFQYSKFGNATTSQERGKEIKLSSRTGMLVFYLPAFVVGVASFPTTVVGLRSLLLSFALTTHYFKRILEVLFLHRYSGNMIIESAVIVSSGYLASTLSMIYAVNITQGMAEPELDLKYAGIVLFLTGIIGNFYHHYLLAKLREKNERGYKIPKGGLFGLVICPHYLFEIIGFIGVSFISQTLYSFSFTLSTLFYLMGRSYATRKWYLSKFQNFPREVKALIPYIF